jgi:hypothetical protein
LCRLGLVQAWCRLVCRLVGGAGRVQAGVWCRPGAGSVGAGLEQQALPVFWTAGVAAERPANTGREEPNRTLGLLGTPQLHPPRIE